MDVPVRQLQEEIVEAAMVIPRECVSEGMIEQTVDVSVSLL